MPDDIESDHNLSIRCPACRQRFNVDKELQDRMVECGGCDARFRIDDEVIIRSKKFYPGERNGPDLNRYQRVPLSAAAPTGMQTMRYAEFKHPEQLGPASPQRVIAGVFGVAMMVLTALVLIFSGDPGGLTNGMPLLNKMVVAGFVSLLGVVLLVYANPKARGKAGLVGLLLATGLCTLPFLSKDIATGELGESVVTDDGADDTATADGQSDPMEELRTQFGIKPLEDERKALGDAGSKNKAYGVFLTSLIQRNKYTARDFLIRETGAGPSSHLFPRDGGNYLMVLTGVASGLEEVSEISARLGSVEKVYPEIGVVVVRVENDQFLAGSAEKLNNDKDPAFYDLNMRELESIDLERVERAVGRLSLAKPTIYRADISRMLVDLMGKPGVRFHDLIARALISWAEEPGPAGRAAVEVIRKNVAEGIAVPENVVVLAVKEKTAEAIPDINALWIKNPSLWASKYVEFGEVIESSVLEQINAEDAPLRRSALTLLARVGTEKSLPALRKLAEDENPDVRVLSERAIARISGR